MIDKKCVNLRHAKAGFSSEKSGNGNSRGAPDLETFNFFQFKKCYVGNGLRVCFLFKFVF